MKWEKIKKKENKKMAHQKGIIWKKKQNNERFDCEGSILQWLEKAFKKL